MALLLSSTMTSMLSIRPYTHRMVEIYNAMNELLIILPFDYHSYLGRIS